MRQVLLQAAITMALMASSVAAQPPAPDKRPEIPKSIANVTSAHFRHGPLFQRAKTAFEAAKQGGEAAFASFLVKKARLELSTYASPQPAKHEPINTKFISALVDSCDGPLSYDEGANWVELNWVCRVDADAPIAQHYAFRESPEIVMLIDFEGNQIKRIDAMEPLTIPGVRRLAMNAYVVAHSKD
ncbi:hypothetical protein [Sphingobium sp. CAP-1]|uniref:hypothetical protein n=1 Tax=Sphingobium sp. CAP-1 TaxID=2676077 RepID=UPI0012BB485D|nr:hypothetical protein [Sphingobium sp. CAP-1]QGP77564.1 hypothetical protein GL174_00065 [Sphingobium sp. CAP-1]